MIDPATFGKMVNEITVQYLANHNKSGELGWRFLYSPRNTLHDNTGFAIAGYNPGGSSYEPPLASVERGNAWMVELWSSSNTQPNFRRFMTQVLKSGSRSSGIPSFLDRCLTFNICPFRSANATNLTRADYDWSVSFWDRYFPVLESQQVFVAVGNSEVSAYRTLIDIFLRAGWRINDRGELPCGWGKYTVRHNTVSNGASSTLIIGVPHFSRFDTRDRNTLSILDGMINGALR
jgi:hypothetical protein